MNNPELELRAVILALTENDNPVKHKAAVDRYFTSDCAFVHPLCSLASGPNSREQLKNIYAVYKYFTRDIHIEIQKITVDSNCTRAVVELEESLSASFLPILRIKNLKIISILDFERIDNKFYIRRQYGERVFNNTGIRILTVLDAFPIDHASEVVPFGFVYTWYKTAGKSIGSFTGSLLQQYGLW